MLRRSGDFRALSQDRWVTRPSYPAACSPEETGSPWGVQEGSERTVKCTARWRSGLDLVSSEKVP